MSNDEKIISKLTTLNSYETSAIQYEKNTQTLHPTEQAQQFLQRLPKAAKILDIGCGPGRDAKIFSDLGLDVAGIDFSSKMIEIAKQTAPKASFYLMDIESLDFPTDTFDGAWANCSLLHIPKKNIPAVLKRIYEVLKPAGILFLSVKEGYHEVLEQDVRYDGLDKFWSFFQKNELCDLLKQAGFNITDASAFNKKTNYETHPQIKVFAIKQ